MSTILRELMKAYLTSILLVMSFFLLAACGANASATEEVELSNVYTAAAATLAAQATPIQPTATQMTIASPTIYTFSTMIPVTVTSQSIVSYSSASTANGCNNATFMSDVTIPDGTILAPDESFVKTWEFQNTGTCDWNEDYLLTFVSGTNMGGDATEIDQDVAVGSAADVSVSLVAPDSEGTYTGYWRVANEDGNAFGQSVYVMIVVSDDASTATPTPTSTTETVESTSTSTPVATETPTSTSTSIPTATLTATIESSPTPSEGTE